MVGKVTDRLTLRDYQEESVQAIYDHFARDPSGDPLVVLPTGAGKSLVLAEFIRRSLDAWPDTRFLVATHVRELVQQNHDEFVRHWGSPLHPSGIYSAGLGRRDARAHVVFASIQSIWRRASDLGAFDLVIIDEAHLIPHRGQGMYRSYIEDLRAINPRVRKVGLTATPFRLDGGWLHKGNGRMFDAIAHEATLEELIHGGYLVPLVARKTKAEVAVDGVTTVRGDFHRKQLEDAARAGDRVKAAIAETVDAGRDRRSWLLFCCGVDHANDVLEELRSHDIKADAVFGHTPRDERDRIVGRFRDGYLRALVNVSVLTTGFNAPRCDMMAMLRPTQSAALYVQMMGRGMRTFPGKDDCLVLDFGRNVERHGPINRIRVRKPRGSNGTPADDEVPAVLACPECMAYVDRGLESCPFCGYAFPIPEPTHDAEASGLAPFDPDAHKSRVLEVDRIRYSRHLKEDRPPSMRVDYLCGMRTFSEWVCPEHPGYAGRKAVSWWTSRGGGAPAPKTVTEMLDRVDELRSIAEIEVRPDGKYDRVVAATFTSQVVRPCATVDATHTSTKERT